MAKHDALIAGPTIDDGVVNFGALGVDHVADFGGVPVETHGVCVVTDAIQHFLGDGDGVYFGGGSNLTGDEEFLRGDEAFAGHFGVGVLGEIRIEDGI